MGVLVVGQRPADSMICYELFWLLPIDHFRHVDISGGFVWIVWACSRLFAAELGIFGIRSLLADAGGLLEGGLLTIRRRHLT